MTQSTKIYDLIRAKNKPVSCEQRLCTEIRALNLSGFCSKPQLKPEDKACLDQKVKETFFKRCKECAGSNPLVYDLVFTKCFTDAMPLVGFKML